MVVVDVIGDGCNGLKKGNLSCIIFLKLLHGSPRATTRVFA